MILEDALLRYHDTKVRTRHIQLYIVTNIIMGQINLKIPEDAHS